MVASHQCKDLTKWRVGWVFQTAFLFGLYLFGNHITGVQNDSYSYMSPRSANIMVLHGGCSSCSMVGSTWLVTTIALQGWVAGTSGGYHGFHLCG